MRGALDTPGPLVEQLAEREAARRRRRGRTIRLWIVVSLGAISALALLIAGLAFQEARDVGRISRERLCVEEQKTRSVLRAIIADARKAVEQIPDRAARKQAREFYDRHLERIDDLDCKEIASSAKGVS